MKVPKVCLPT
jgi:hypothetical protein